MKTSVKYAAFACSIHKAVSPEKLGLIVPQGGRVVVIQGAAGFLNGYNVEHAKRFKESPEEALFRTLQEYIGDEEAWYIASWSHHDDGKYTVKVDSDWGYGFIEGTAEEIAKEMIDWRMDYEREDK